MFRRVSNWASLRIGISSSSALVTFDAPGSLPTTSAKVLFETEPGALPPRSVIAVLASELSLIHI